MLRLNFNSTGIKQCHDTCFGLSVGVRRNEGVGYERLQILVICPGQLLVKIFCSNFNSREKKSVISLESV